MLTIFDTFSIFDASSIINGMTGSFLLVILKWLFYFLFPVLIWLFKKIKPFFGIKEFQKRIARFIYKIMTYKFTFAHVIVGLLFTASIFLLLSGGFIVGLEIIYDKPLLFIVIWVLCILYYSLYFIYVAKYIHKEFIKIYK